MRPYHCLVPMIQSMQDICSESGYSYTMVSYTTLNVIAPYYKMDKHILYGYFSDSYPKDHDVQYLQVYHCTQCDKGYKIWTCERLPLVSCFEGHEIHESSVSVVEKKLLLVPISASHDFTSTISSSDFEGQYRVLVKRVAYLEQKIIELIGTKP